jgi:hypothetical protein
MEPLRHRQTKEAATDMFYLKPPRHISTLPILLKKSKLSGSRNRAKVGFKQSPPLQASVGQVRRSVIAFVEIDVVPHVAGFSVARVSVFSVSMARSWRLRRRPYYRPRRSRARAEARDRDGQDRTARARRCRDGPPVRR